MEQAELYDIAVMSGVTVLRNWRVSSPTVTYLAAEQITDFGAAPTTLILKITQVSALVGLGEALTVTVAVE